MKDLRKNIRKVRRVALGTTFVALSLPVLALQSAVIGPVFKNNTTVPNLFYNGLKMLLGIRVEFNKNSAPLDSRQKWLVSNHMSAADFVVTGSTFKALFVAAGKLADNKLIKAAGKAGKIMFVTQRKEDEFKQRDRGLIVEAFNNGDDVLMFPEGKLNDGTQVALFRAGLMSVLYGEPATDINGQNIQLKNEDVVVQPVAVKVKAVNGESVDEDQSLRDAYCMAGRDNMLKRIWDRLGHRRITMELTVLPALEPKNFEDAKELMNTAHEQIVNIVSPWQDVIEKRAAPLIPLEVPVKEKKSDSKAPTPGRM